MSWLALIITFTLVKLLMTPRFSWALTSFDWYSQSYWPNIYLRCIGLKSPNPTRLNPKFTHILFHLFWLQFVQWKHWLTTFSIWYVRCQHWNASNFFFLFLDNSIVTMGGRRFEPWISLLEALEGANWATRLLALQNFLDLV